MQSTHNPQRKNISYSNTTKVGSERIGNGALSSRGSIRSACACVCITCSRHSESAGNVFSSTDTSDFFSTLAERKA